MYRAGLVSRSALIKGVYAQIVYLLLGADEKKLDRLKNGMLALSKGWEREQVEAVVREALIELIDPFIYQEALDLMDLHRASGRRVYIVSSSPEEVVRPVAEHFGDVRVIATRAKIEDGRYTGELEFYCAGEGKAEAIREVAAREGVDLSESYAYSDSESDLPMLRAVGHPVAVNPDPPLAALAREEGWQTMRFERLGRRLVALIVTLLASVAGFGASRVAAGRRKPQPRRFAVRR
jgi:HAD superfamily hydrolase (TIGR01490 family)